MTNWKNTCGMNSGIMYWRSTTGISMNGMRILPTHRECTISLIWKVRKRHLKENKRFLGVTDSTKHYGCFSEGSSPSGSTKLIEIRWGSSAGRARAWRAWCRRSKSVPHHKILYNSNIFCIFVQRVWHDICIYIIVVKQKTRVLWHLAKYQPEVWVSGLNQQFAKLPTLIRVRRFESSCFRKLMVSWLSGLKRRSWLTNSSAFRGNPLCRTSLIRWKLSCVEDSICQKWHCKSWGCGVMKQYKHNMLIPSQCYRT